ncbi:MAG: hypothetical protein WCW33_06195 [Candidatus Babeliales bacterium]
MNMSSMTLTSRWLIGILILAGGARAATPASSTSTAQQQPQLDKQTTANRQQEKARAVYSEQRMPAALKERLAAIEKKIALITQEQGVYHSNWAQYTHDTIASIFTAQKADLQKIKDDFDVLKGHISAERLREPRDQYETLIKRANKFLRLNEIDERIKRLQTAITALEGQWFKSQETRNGIGRKILILQRNAYDFPERQKRLTQLLSKIGTWKKTDIQPINPNIEINRLKGDVGGDLKPAQQFALGILLIDAGAERDLFIKKFVLHVLGFEQKRRNEIFDAVKDLNFDLAIALKDAFQKSDVDILLELRPEKTVNEALNKGKRVFLDQRRVL